uniref:Reticulon n=1 Tax=Macaca mulatta TaxID=9544 RepID=A0A5F8ANA7_MACMU
RDLSEPVAGLFYFPSLSPAPCLYSPFSHPRSRSYGGAIGSHSVPFHLLVVVRSRAVRARRRREPRSLPRPGDEELQLLLCGARSDFLERCEEDWVCLWHHADHAAFPGSFQCHQCGFLPHPGSSLCHHQLQDLQVRHPSCTEVRRRPSIQAYLDVDITLSSEAFHNYMNAAMVHINRALKLIIRLFLVEDLVDSLKLAVFMWLMTYVGAVFNGITLLILAELLVFSVPIVYEKYKTQIDHYVGIARDQTKSIVEKIQAKLPGIAKKKAE